MYNAVIQHPAAHGEPRQALRHDLVLKLPAHLGDRPVELHARNISRTGFLAGTLAPVQLGDELTLMLPEVGSCRAMVVWKSGAHIGCNFLQVIPRCAVSAALLKAAARATPDVGVYVEPASGLPPAGTDKRLPPRTRLMILLACATIPWMSIGAVIALL